MKSNKEISSVKSVTLESSSYTYNGKAKKPAVTVKDSSGKVISNGNYTVTYQNNVKVGKATATIKLKGNYEGTLTKNLQSVQKEPPFQERLQQNPKDLL